MKRNLALAVLLSFALLLSASVGYGAIAQINVTIITANNTQFNSTTPIINVSCMDSSGPTNTSTFNITVYNASATGSGGVFNSNVSNNVAANKSVLITLQTIEAPSIQHIAVRCYNGSAAAFGGQLATAANDSNWGIDVNLRPVLTAVEATGGFIAKGTDVTFKASWTDFNNTNYTLTTSSGSKANDSVRFYVCSADQFASNNAACVSEDTQYCSTSGVTDATNTCTYNVPFTSYAGTYTAYFFALDDNDYTSASLPVTFSVGGTFTEEQQAAEDTFVQQQQAEQAAAAARAAAAAQGTGGGGIPRNIGGVPTALLVVIVVVVLVIGWFLFKGNPFQQN